MRKHRQTKKIIMDIILVLAVLMILGLVLYFVQTEYTMKRQVENFSLELDLAQRRMQSNEAMAAESRASYDAFNQAKIDSLAYYYETNEAADFDQMAAEWELDELYMLDRNQAGQLEQLLQDDGTMVYYASKLKDGGILIGGRESQAEFDYEKALTMPDYSLGNIRVGSTGYIVAVDCQEGMITYHPQKELIGQNVEKVGIDKAHLYNGYCGWITRQGNQFYCQCRELSETCLLIATIPKAEMDGYGMRKIMLLLAMFALILILIVIYVNLVHTDRLKKHKHQSEADVIKVGRHLYLDKILANKCKNILIIGMVLLFCSSYYVQWLNVLSAQSVRFDNKLTAMDAIFKENEATLLELKKQYNEEYAGRAENVAGLIAHDPTLLDDARLSELAERAQIEFIYVFDEQGKTVATNTAYKDFTLSRNKEDQSYAFWDVVKGYKNVIVQEAQEDDTAEHGYMQYIGVERQDAPGMVQLGLSPRRLQSRIRTAQLTEALHNVAVEDKGFVFAIDTETRLVTYYPNASYMNADASRLGVTDAVYEDDYTGYQTIIGTKCFVSGMQYEDQYIYVAVPVRNIGNGILEITFIVTAVSLFLLVLLMGSLLLRHHVDDIQEEDTDEDKTTENAGQFKAEPKGMIDVQLGEKSRRVQSIVGRYDNTAKIPWRDQSPEEKMKRIIYIILLLTACIFVVIVYLQRGAYDKNSIFSYIIHKRWEKKPNIFSYTYIGIVMIEVLVITSVLRKLIKMISSDMGARAETIGRLICSFAKYISIIGAIFYCMSFIGIDSKALFASAGIMGIVLGLGAQSLISDVLAGIFIVFEGEFRVGDIITIGTWRGTVLEIGIRSTKVEDASQNIKIFNNSTVKEVVNMTKKYSQAYCDLGIEYDESLEHVESVLKKELPLMKERLSNVVSGPYYKGVVGLNDSCITLRILAQCEEKDRIQLTRDLTRELKLMCDKYNISIPFPQVVINQPKEHKKVTQREKNMAEEFVKAQKEDSKGISVDN